MSSSALTFRFDSSFKGLTKPAAIISAVLLIASIVGGIFTPDEFFRSYLIGFLFWIGLALGSLGIVMMQYLTGGAWGVVTRRTFEAATRTLPLMALLFIPIAVGIPRLYQWSNASIVNADDILKHRHPYMNTWMFIARTIVYFAIWCSISFFLNKWSKKEDEEGGQRDRLGRLSAPGLIIYVFTVTFASVDWAESLASHWYSTMWGFLFVANQGLAAMAFAIIVLAFLRRRHPMSEVLRSSHFHDLGKLLLMFVMLWAYFAFSQLLIVWSGNLSNEIPWYYPRFTTSWSKLGLTLYILQFMVPFLLLLSRRLKKNAWSLSCVVGILLITRFMDLYWIVMPEFYRTGFQAHWLNLTVPLGLGGAWLAMFMWQLKKLPLLPLRDPTLEQALHHGE